MTARSLRPLLEGKTRSHRDFIRSGLGGWRLVSDGRYKLIRGFDPSERGAIAAHTQQEMKGAPPLLFDLESDPLENRNIAAQAPEVVARLSELLPPPDADPKRGVRAREGQKG